VPKAFQAVIELHTRICSFLLASRRQCSSAPFCGMRAQIGESHREESGRHEGSSKGKRERESARFCFGVHAGVDTAWAAHKLAPSGIAVHNILEASFVLCYGDRCYGDRVG
jgi:hypothetical protein